MRRITVLRSLALLLFFFSVTFFAYSQSEMIFNSPDENANAVFALQFAQDQTLAIQSQYQGISWTNLVHPRSMIVVSRFPSFFKEWLAVPLRSSAERRAGVVTDSIQYIVPVSFLGLSVLSGLFAFIFGSWSISLVTPLLAVLAIFAWKQILYRLTENERLSDFGALLLMIHPAFWYYTGRTMMHNVGFVALLLLALYFIVCQPIKANWQKTVILDEFLAGLMLGLAISFRASEAVWVGVLVVGFLFWQRKELVLKNVFVFLISAVLILLPFLALNKVLYGSMLETGYTVADQSQTEAPLLPKEESGVVAYQDSNIDKSWPAPLNVLFPFGIHEMNILRNVWQYGFLLYPWMSILSILGIIFVFKDKGWRPLLIITFGLSIWLAFVYGSWKFTDNPDASILTLGNSYVRYWLPLFVLGSLFAGIAVDKIGAWLKRRDFPFADFGPWLIIFLVFLFSVRLVIWGNDGFIQTHDNLESFTEKKQIVLEQTPPDCIIIVDMADKYIFPDRSVITPLRDENVYQAIPEILDQTSMFYFGITLPKTDIEHLQSVVFAENDIQFRKIATVGDESLYAIIKN
ncbi:MAG: hypothetical protein UU40_C0003G0049 [Candidatus Uhrbacteria bacterium GW2011_GWD2_41_121]|uniref:Glycosyltransferase RgtA/B/C/D-like domain-containing protein n=1 Tax=Candidatus Uhrbacteria bacterium GW2011_GWC1_41_20 TaxID=1618983 RepID=A0A0G0VG12_9BACT|nr:MAG: hypothetical protein UT52_C0003G0049 [Candidatus Uhrbacteria bacterium GW2011_GWE1_39_46]KKR64309.1 MAG: hypothetical protein UU04_C0003G0049 [Candidatus Uhrbacteria bacterium GW2011_GWC2_40_450]KKR90479.1 MAG: hypothetical protein UU40_C0003G0049 [Candidatus Uhrbacteria bacterium GW2011_GWD2_41_121]KKR96326.1 MAG: hypothetical protein UU46_C0004G0012 [Candidatus Uhrbacteria bacterium GW2011_GWD1_41_16]KKR99743.1 MAG: hypothetical protein UU50_C0003G0048 [Candidatus Uhrbacteria bacteriu